MKIITGEFNTFLERLNLTSKNKGKTMRDQFIFRKQYRDAIEACHEDIQFDLYQALFNYVFDGDTELIYNLPITVRAIFDFIKDDIEG